MNNFARTDAWFNRQLFQKGTVSNKKNKTILNPINNERDSMRHFSPQKMRTQDTNISALSLEKQPISQQDIFGEGNRRAAQGSTSFQFSSSYKPVENYYQDYPQGKGMGQKQGSSNSLRQQREDRPKTNQSSKRPFIHSQPSLDHQNNVQHKPVEQKSYSLTMGTHNKNGLRPTPIKAQQQSFGKIRE